MKHNIILNLLLVLLLSACGNNKEVFIIEGRINNLGGRPLYALYETPDGIAKDTLIPYEGKIEMRGSSDHLVAVQLYKTGWEPFMRLYLRNNERVEIEGDANIPYEIKMKGSKLNRNLWKLICDNNELFEMAQSAGQKDMRAFGRINGKNRDIARLDSCLINFIDRHPKNMLSSILIGDYLLRYDNVDLCDSLWQNLNEKALWTPAGEALEHMKDITSFNDDNLRLPHMRYFDDTDTMRYLAPRNSKATLLCIWRADGKNASLHHSELEKYATRYNKETLQVVAISFDSDTALWHKIVRRDTSRVIDLWNDNVFTSRSMKNHNLTRIPTFMLADSKGNIVVRTSHLPDADVERQLDSLIQVSDYVIDKPIFNP